MDEPSAEVTVTVVTEPAPSPTPDPSPTPAVPLVAGEGTAALVTLATEQGSQTERLARLEEQLATLAHLPDMVARMETAIATAAVAEMEEEEEAPAVESVDVPASLTVEPATPEPAPKARRGWFASLLLGE